MRIINVLVLILSLCYPQLMPRIPRIVVPGVAHHVTQRGNRRLQTLFVDADYRRYVELIAEGCRQDAERMRTHIANGRALGGDVFMAKVEAHIGQSLRRRPPGRPIRADAMPQSGKVQQGVLL